MNTIQQAHILLVDDNTDLLRLLEEQLRGAGYQNIRTVQNCAAAQTAFAAEMPELMILDINLPDGDGFSLFRILRAKADVPTLFLSARDADADRLFGLGLGADDYLTKPFLMQELLFAGAAPFAACLPDRAFPDKSSNLAAGRPERGPARCPCDPAGRNYPCPDSDRADAFAQAGRKPRAYRDLRCAVRSSVGRGLLWV